MEPVGKDKDFLVGLHQHIVKVVGDQIQQDDHSYTKHLTLFTTKPDHTLPQLLAEELDLGISDSLQFIDGKSCHVKNKPIKVIPITITIRRLGSAAVVNSIRYDHDSITAVFDPLDVQGDEEATHALLNMLETAKSKESTSSKVKIH